MASKRKGDRRREGTRVLSVRGPGISLGLSPLAPQGKMEILCIA